MRSFYVILTFLIIKFLSFRVVTITVVYDIFAGFWLHGALLKGEFQLFVSIHVIGLFIKLGLIYYLL